MNYVTGNPNRFSDLDLNLDLTDVPTIELEAI